jgi:hypothetical protein
MTGGPAKTLPAGRGVVWLASLVFLAAAGFYLWTEHRAHLYGALPYLLFLACPLMHLFMHRGHGGHAGHGPHQVPNKVQETEEGSA